MNKIEKLKKERKDIIDSASKKIPKNTLIDEVILNNHNIYHTIISSIKEETNDTKTFTLTIDKESNTTMLPPFTPGEYITVYLTISDIPTSRAYSLSSSPNLSLKNEYEITVKRVEGGLVSNYMLDELKVGDKLDISNPSGNFGYNPVRDEKNVVAIAGGSGITPFMSLARAILEGMYDCNLTVFYSVKTYDDIIFRKEIEEINKKNKNVCFIITLTREEKDGFLHGHLNKEMIEPYIKEFNTILMCGPKSIYKAMNEILNEFNIPRKSVHYENFAVTYEPDEIKTYELKVIMNESTVTIPCKSNETLLVTMEKNKIKAPSLCRVGECGYCRSKLLVGKVKMIGASIERSLEDDGYIHPCVSYPDSDITLKLDI